MERHPQAGGPAHPLRPGRQLRHQGAASYAIPPPSPVLRVWVLGAAPGPTAPRPQHVGDFTLPAAPEGSDLFFDFEDPVRGGGLAFELVGGAFWDPLGPPRETHGLRNVRPRDGEEGREGEAREEREEGAGVDKHRLGLHALGGQIRLYKCGG